MRDSDDAGDSTGSAEDADSADSADGEALPGFVDAVLVVVDDIPPGQVLSYGDVAALLGTRAARAVGSVMRRYGHTHAWWRVIRSGGLPPTGHESAARAHYEAEGTPLRAISREPWYAVDYAKARWRPLHQAADVERTDHST